MSMVAPVRWGLAMSPSACAALPLISISRFWYSTVRTAELTSSGCVKAGFVGARQVGEKAGRPGAAVAAVLGQFGIDDEPGRDRNGNQHAAGDAIVEVVVVQDAFEAVGFGLYVLPFQGLQRAAQRRHGDDSCLVQWNRGSLSGNEGRGPLHFRGRRREGASRGSSSVKFGSLDGGSRTDGCRAELRFVVDDVAATESDSSSGCGVRCAMPGNVCRGMHGCAAGRAPRGVPYRARSGVTEFLVRGPRCCGMPMHPGQVSRRSASRDREERGKHEREKGEAHHGERAENREHH